MDGGDRVGQESALRRAVLAGDEAAWRAWYDTAAPLLRAFVHWRCPGLPDFADEVVQETWLVAIRRVRTFRPEDGPFAGWLCGIAANLIRNRLRKRRANPSPSASEAHADPRWRSGSDRTDELVAKALAELPPRYEQVLRHKYLDGLGVQAIADLTGDSGKAVESLLTRARQAFREAYRAAEKRDG